MNSHHQLTPAVHLKHLTDHRGFMTVYDPRSNAVAFWADEAIVRELIREKKIRPGGTRKCIRRLEWIGPELSTLSNVVREETGAGSAGSSSRSPRKYSHNQERTSTDQRYVAPFDENPRGVWTLIRLPNSTQIVFLAVVEQCGGRIVKRIVKRTASFARTQKNQ